jgi:hypothetical protein
MFRFTVKPSSGRHSQYLTNITHSDQCEYMEVVQTLSVLWLHSMTCAVHTCHRSYYAAITLTSVRPPCIHIEPNV